MDWFEHLTGFQEGPYVETQAKLSVVGGRLQSPGANSGFAVGTLTLASLSDLRARSGNIRLPGRLRLSIAEGDVRAMHRLPENRGALFQVASQFNMLEMVGPSVTTEEGVTRYEHDRTQGPACAMAAGAATIYRNYLVPFAGEIGQTADRQLNGLADLGSALAQRLGPAVTSPWTMRNGYALATADGLRAIAAILSVSDAGTLDGLCGLLRVGLHADVEVTNGDRGHFVSQLFCSALPVAYSGLPSSSWAPFARLCWRRLTRRHCWPPR